MTGQSSDRRPVFVVGMNGSGTTMMLDLLDSHPDLYGFRRETLIIPHFVTGLERFGDLNDDANFEALWREFAGAPVFTFVNGGDPIALPDDWRDYPRTLAAVIDGTYRYFATKQGKFVWCEKTPMHVQHIDTLQSVFPEARFIHMVRDGRACAASLRRRWKYHPCRSMLRWKHLVPMGRRLAEACGASYLEVRYEHLTADPEATMREVCRFLEVDWDPSVLKTSRVRTFTGTEQTEIVQRKAGWAAALGARQVARLERIGGKLLADLGYEVDDDQGDWNPPARLRRWWMFRDDLYLLWRALFTEVTVRDKRQRWDSLGNRIRAALRQRLTSRH